MLKKRNVIIDCDPGIDDSLALMLALSSPELEVVGITIVCGNAPVELGVINTLKVLKLMNRLDVPIYRGEDRPLVREYVSAQDTHGMDGLGENHIPLVSEEEGIVAEGGVDFIISALKKYENLSIIALGPLTNIAKALQQDEGCFHKIEQFVSMGGSFKSHGNCSPVAEYNYWCDPHASNIVFETFQKIDKSIHMVGLDVTREIVLTPDMLLEMKQINKEKSEFISEIVPFYFDFHWEQEHIIGCVINDPLAVAYFIQPSLCTGFEAFTTVETEGICMGQSVVDSMNFWKQKPNSYILTETDSEAFFNFFSERVLGKTL